MGLSMAEKNRRKRERKKKEREARRKQEEEEEKKQREEKETKQETSEEVEIEYVPEQIHVEGEGMESVLLRFQERAAYVVTEDEEEDVKEEAVTKSRVVDKNDFGDNELDENSHAALSKRKLRELLRPTVADLKRRIKRPDLVEAHDVTAADPDFLIYLKAVPGSVPVPRHWGRKRKYLQGKRGFEKPPFHLPDFIAKTGIMDIRDNLAEDESKMTAKQKNRSRVAPKMGAMDVDYRTLHDAFFKHQTKPDTLTRVGDLYYEGKELEARNKIQPGSPLSSTLREALGMTSESFPPPWLVNMQRYGPPPSYPNLKIPGLNAPLPSNDCQFGYHVGGWGKPPVDNYGRPLYGGNPFDPPGDINSDFMPKDGLVTSDGKTIGKAEWGSLPSAFPTMNEESEDEDDDDEDEESSKDEMEESEEEGEETGDGTESVLPQPPSPKVAPSATDLRKEAGDETPMPSKPKQLYQIVAQEKAAGSDSRQFFGSEVSYVVPEGVESVLSKASPQDDAARKKRKLKEQDEDDDLGKNFKF